MAGGGSRPAVQCVAAARRGYRQQFDKERETALSGKHDKAADPEAKSELLLTGPIAIRGLGRATRDFFRPDKVTKHRAAGDEPDGDAEDAPAEAEANEAAETPEAEHPAAPEPPVEEPAATQTAEAQPLVEPVDDDDRVPTAQIPLSWMFTGAPTAPGGESELVTAGGAPASQPRVATTYPAAMDAAALDRLRRRMVDRTEPEEFAPFESDSEESAAPSQGSEDDIQNERSSGAGDGGQSASDGDPIRSSEPQEVVPHSEPPADAASEGQEATTANLGSDPDVPADAEPQDDAADTEVLDALGLPAPDAAPAEPVDHDEPEAPEAATLPDEEVAEADATELPAEDQPESGLDPEPPAETDPPVEEALSVEPASEAELGDADDEAENEPRPDANESPEQDSAAGFVDDEVAADPESTSDPVAEPTAPPDASPESEPGSSNEEAADAETANPLEEGTGDPEPQPAEPDIALAVDEAEPEQSELPGQDEEPVPSLEVPEEWTPEDALQSNEQSEPELVDASQSHEAAGDLETESALGGEDQADQDPAESGAPSTLDEAAEPVPPVDDQDDRWNSYAFSIDPSPFTHPAAVPPADLSSPTAENEAPESDEEAELPAEPALAEESTPADESRPAEEPDTVPQLQDDAAEPADTAEDDSAQEALPAAAIEDGADVEPEPNGSEDQPDEDSEPNGPAVSVDEHDSGSGSAAAEKPSGRAQVAFTAIAAALGAAAVTAAAVDAKRFGESETNDEPESAVTDKGSAAETATEAPTSEVADPAASSSFEEAVEPSIDGVSQGTDGVGPVPTAEEPPVIEPPLALAAVDASDVATSEKPRRERPPRPTKPSRPVRPPRAPLGGSDGGRPWGYVALAVLAVICIALVIAVVVKTRHDADLAAKEAAAYTPPPLTTPSATPSPSIPVVSVVGDEFTAGTSADSGTKAEWPALLATAVKADVKTYAAAGVGYVTKGSGGATVLSEVGKVDPASTVVVLFAGTNDRSSDTLTLASAATKAINAAHMRAPKATIVVVGPASGLATPAPALTAVRNTLRTAASIGKATFEDPIAGNWLSGSASLTDSTGRPTDAGERALEANLAGVVKGLL